MGVEREGRVRVWNTHAPGSSYPEDESVGPDPRTGVCFSGGSTRSYAATVGQLRGLTQLGLIPRVTYMSAVSGGAWAAAAYAFYRGSARDDTQILGEATAPGNLKLDRLGRIEPWQLAYGATRRFSHILHAAREDRSIRSSAVWSHTIGRTFLEPFGLFDPDQPAGFTLDAGRYDEYRGRNPAASGVDPPHLVRTSSDRPYLLVHAALNWPPGPGAERVGFEMSPLGVGSPHAVRLRGRDGESHLVGGGFVETLAFGCDAPSTAPDERGLVTAALPEAPFTLAEAIGASSAFSAAERDVSQYPHVRYWPVTSRTGEAVSTELLTDGGDIENYGLLPLLRRRVTTVVVFINTVWPLDLDYDPSRWPDDAQRPRIIDPFLAPLFGAPSGRGPHNGVFPAADFAELVAELQGEKRAGRPLVSVRTHTVKPNEWWGIAGGWEVNVCWVYNDRVGVWEQQLPLELRAALAAGRTDAAGGPVARFPHYLTRGQNPGALIELTPVQVGLLIELSCWNVTSNAERLDGFLP